MFESEGAKVLDKDQGTKVGYTDPGYPSWGTQTQNTHTRGARTRGICTDLIIYHQFESMPL